MKRLALIAIVLASCTKSYEEKLALEVQRTYEMAMKIGNHVNDKITRIEKQAIQSSEQQKKVLLDSVSVLRADFDQWKSTSSNVIDLRNNGIEDKVQLFIQNDLRKRIIYLNIRTQNILNAIKGSKRHEPSEEKAKAAGNRA